MPVIWRDQCPYCLPVGYKLHRRLFIIFPCFCQDSEFLSLLPRDRNSHHIKPPDSAGYTAGGKGTLDLDHGEKEAGEVEVKNQAGQPGERLGEVWLCSGFYTSILQSFSARLSLTISGLFLK